MSLKYIWELLRTGVFSINSLKIKEFMNLRKKEFFMEVSHSNDIHYKCLQHLKDRQFIIIAVTDLDDSFSENGLIVARVSYFPGIDAVNISTNGF